MALATTFQINLEAALSKALDLLGTDTVHSIVHKAVISKSLTTGTGVGSADTVFADTRTLGSGATEDIDLAGTLVNSFGDAAVFAKVKLLYLKSADANTVNLTVFGDAASAPFLNTPATTTTVTPGGIILLYNPTGYVVTATTADILQVAAGAASSVYDLIVIGTSV